MTDDSIRLPVVQDEPDEEPASCSPSIYVSNEEAMLLDAMRELHRRSSELKREATEAQGEARGELEAELAGLRERWHELAARREKAYIRKMIMLGHLPPEADPDL